MKIWLLGGRAGLPPEFVQSQRGIAAIAKRYVRDEGFRARITAVVEALPAADQARFVQVLRAAVRQR